MVLSMELEDVDTWSKWDADSIRDRVIWVTRDFAGSRYGYLEERTGIAARKWKNMCNRVTYPSPEMMCQLALVRPYFAAWMLTGFTCGVQFDPIKEPDWQRKHFEMIESVIRSKEAQSDSENGS